MSNIQYVCISDLHLGEEDSLLTSLGEPPSGIDPLGCSLVMKALFRCLRYLIGKNDDSAPRPKLILAGDILELALATTNEASMVFERMVELILAPGKELFDEIIYIPGNHDHHLWETARETQYVDYLKDIRTGQYFKTPWHTSNLFKRRTIKSPLLTGLAQRFPNVDPNILIIFYPNYAIAKTVNGQRKCVIFTHGHFVEGLYHAMSDLKTLVFTDRQTPKHIWDIEAENFAWIDFFWSTLGRSHKVGQRIEDFYEMLGDPNDIRKLLNYAGKRVTRKYYVPWPLSCVVRFIVTHFGMKLLVREKHETAAPLTDKAKQGLRRYVEGPLLKQVLSERDQLPDPDTLADEVNLVFGHTHKPFSRPMEFKGYPERFCVYNTGGWVVESKKPNRLHGGAVVLIDEDLNTVSLRMYNECKQREEYSVKVECAKDVQELPNPLYTKIAELVEANKSIWAEFSEVVAAAVSDRGQRLKTRVERLL